MCLTLLFISNLPSQREVHVTPQLAFTVNDSRFDSGAQPLPFDASRRTEARLSLQHLDLALYPGKHLQSNRLSPKAGMHQLRWIRADFSTLPQTFARGTLNRTEQVTKAAD